MTFNATYPDADASPDLMPAQMQANWARLQTIIGAQHVFNASADGTDGDHKVVELTNQTSHPTNDDIIKFYSKTEYSVLGKMACLQSASSGPKANFKTWLNRIGNTSALTLAATTAENILDLSGVTDAAILECMAFEGTNTGLNVFAHVMACFDGGRQVFTNLGGSNRFLSYTGAALFPSTAYTNANVAPTKLVWQSDGATKLQLYNTSNSAYSNVWWVVEVKRIS